MENKLTFEQSLEQLENIVSSLEKGECSLEEAIELYTNGAKLASECNKLLENAKLTIKTLSEAEAEKND